MLDRIALLDTKWSVFSGDTGHISATFFPPLWWLWTENGGKYWKVMFIQKAESFCGWWAIVQRSGKFSFKNICQLPIYIRTNFFNIVFNNMCIFFILVVMEDSFQQEIWSLIISWMKMMVLTATATGRNCLSIGHYAIHPTTAPIYMDYCILCTASNLYGLLHSMYSLYIFSALLY